MEPTVCWSCGEAPALCPCPTEQQDHAKQDYYDSLAEDYIGRQEWSER